MDSRMSVMVTIPMKSPNSFTTKAMCVDSLRICSSALRMVKLSNTLMVLRARFSRFGSSPASKAFNNSFLCTKPSGSSTRPSRINGKRE
ncbi:hypothetical protein D3C78_1639610 [compost metagenome]